jgi:ABC-2 type transport system permease protein
MILRTSSLTRTFGKLTAVDGVSLEVEAGEVFGLLGSNGAGKSTLIKMLTTLLPPSAGHASIAGFDIHTQAAEVRRAIGYVPQMSSVDGALTARENMEVFARLYQVSDTDLEARIEESLKHSRLADVADRLVNTYSGGMGRHLEIAISTLHGPRLLFLDEPTSGLDPVARESVWERIQTLRRDLGMTIFLTTHHMDEAESLCSRIAIMHKGRVAAIGTPQELKDSIGLPGATLDQVFIYYSAKERPATTTRSPASPGPTTKVDDAPVPNNPPGGRFSEFFIDAFAIVQLEAHKLRHDPTELISRAVQPMLWLLIFGNVMSKMRGIPTGGMPYLAFMAPGILSQSVLFMAIFYGISSIRERDTGIIVRFLVSPAPRTALVLGKALAAGMRALSQTAIVYVVVLLMGVHLNPNPLTHLGVIVLALLGAAFFSLFSLLVASFTKTQERFMGVGQLMTMPLFFASSALYPIAMMPTWLQLLSHVNPLTYQVDAMRALMLEKGISEFGLGTDFAVLGFGSAAMIWIAGRLYARIIT